MSSRTYTNDDFDDLSWHDCAVYGLFMDTDGATTSELVLDIDFITEWICGADKRPAFRVAAATLRFHGVSDPSVRLDRRPGDAYQVAVSPAYIYDMRRERVQDQLVHLDRPYYAWEIVLHSGPEEKGYIRFGAWGFTQTLRHDPVDTGNLQQLDPGRRPSLFVT